MGDRRVGADQRGEAWVPGAAGEPPWGRLTLPSLISRPGLEADKAALRLDGASRSYRQLAERSGRVADALVGRFGVRPVDRVAIVARNRLDYLEAEVAIAAAGGVMVAMSWRYTQPERVDVLRRSRARVVLADADVLPALAAARSRGELPDVAALVSLGSSAEAEACSDASYDDLAAHATSPRPRLPAGRLTDPHEIIYTSGTTGAAKGAVWTQGAVLWNSVQQVMDYGLRADHSAYVCFDLNYIGGRHQFTWGLLHQGGTVHLRRSGGFDAREVLSYVVTHRITHVLWVPTMLYDILALDAVAELDTSALEMIMCGGAPLSAEAVRRAQRAFPHTRVVQVYGLTEGGGTVTFVPARQLATKIGSAGLPSLHNELRIVAPDGSPVEPGAVGEILVRGPCVTPGYWDDPVATAEAIRDGWLWTGDLGSLDEDGFLFISGRRKELIISGGMNIFPSEVEEVLREHPGVRDAAVIGIPHERWGETVCAVVELLPGTEATEATEQELVELCRARLAGYKKPTAVRFTTALPRTLSGKVRKNELTDAAGAPPG